MIRSHHETLHIALDAIHCPPDELAAMIRMDLEELRQVYAGRQALQFEAHERLVELLLTRAAELRRAACLLRDRQGTSRSLGRSPAVADRVAGPSHSPNVGKGEPTRFAATRPTWLYAVPVGAAPAVVDLPTLP